MDTTVNTSDARKTGTMSICLRLTIHRISAPTLNPRAVSDDGDMKRQTGMVRTLNVDGGTFPHDDTRCVGGVIDGYAQHAR